MKYFAFAAIYVAFFALVGGAVYMTGSGTPLWALLLFPTIEMKAKNTKPKVVSTTETDTPLRGQRAIAVDLSEDRRPKL